MSHPFIDWVAERIATVAAYLTSGAVAVSGFTMQEAFGFVGVALAGATFVVNWYYKQRHLEIAEREQARKEWVAMAQAAEDKRAERG